MTLDNPCDEVMTRRRFLTIQALSSGRPVPELDDAPGDEPGGERRTWEEWEREAHAPAPPPSRYPHSGKYAARRRYP